MLCCATQLLHRSFLSRPLLSDDGQGADKHKMERFLQPGATLVGSAYGPIAYLPLPLLAFKVGARLRARLCARVVAATSATAKSSLWRWQETRVTSPPSPLA